MGLRAVAHEATPAISRPAPRKRRHWVVRIRLRAVLPESAPLAPRELEPATGPAKCSAGPKTRPAGVTSETRRPISGELLISGTPRVLAASIGAPNAVTSTDTFQKALHGSRPPT